jgi:predicted cobalt transporter CbtA
VEVRSLGTVLKAVILAGLLAGLTLAVFHSLLTEPVIDRAIAIEESREGHLEEGPPLVSRDTQKRGLVVGSLLYGVFVGLIFGGVFYLAQSTLPTRRVLTRAALLALGAYWLLVALPFLKYPANPPGVGQPETIEYRQALYLGFLLLSMLGGVAAAVAAQRGVPRFVAAAGYAVFVLALYLLMPPNPDPIEIPLEIVLRFRALSLAGLTLFWLVLGLASGLLAEHLQPNGDSRNLQPRTASEPS